MYVCICIYVVRMYMFREIWEFAQSADCVAQTEDPKNVCQSADCAILIAQSAIIIVQTVEPQISP